MGFVVPGGGFRICPPGIWPAALLRKTAASSRRGTRGLDTTALGKPRLTSETQTKRSLQTPLPTIFLRPGGFLRVRQWGAPWQASCTRHTKAKPAEENSYNGSGLIGPFQAGFRTCFTPSRSNPAAE